MFPIPCECRLTRPSRPLHRRIGYSGPRSAFPWQEGDIVHVEMLTLWRDWQAIERFAGQPLDKAKYYDFDPDFLLELEPAVTHFEVIEGPSIPA